MSEKSIVFTFSYRKANVIQLDFPAKKFKVNLGSSFEQTIFSSLFLNKNTGKCQRSLRGSGALGFENRVKTQVGVNFDLNFRGTRY